MDDPDSARVEVQDATTGEVRATQDVDWCGGEGPEHKACVLLDATRIAHTPVLRASGDPDTVTISSMVDGTTLAELGPFAALLEVLGTESSDEVLLLDPGSGSRRLRRPTPAPSSRACPAPRPDHGRDGRHRPLPGAVLAPVRSRVGTRCSATWAAG